MASVLVKCFILYICWCF